MAVYHRVHGSRGQGRGNNAFFGAQEGGKGKLGPSLVKVGRAAAKVGLQPEEVAVRAIGAENHVILGQQRALHLIGLLVVLVRPHIGTDGGSRSK